MKRVIQNILIVSVFFFGFCPAVKSQGGFQRWLQEKPKGLYNNTSFAIVSERGNLFSGMQTSFGYKFNPHLGLGGGIGIERFSNLPTYSYYEANFTLLPVFAELRYTVLKTRFSPVIAVQGGYKILVNTPSSQMDEWMTWIYPPYAWNYYYNYDIYHRGGPFVTIEIGVNAKVYKRFGIYASVDYSLWSVSGDNHYWVYQATSFDPGQTTAIVNEYITNVFAYQHIFLFRLGFTF
ncbi:MAG: hypothetical protein NTX43_12460 [Bacteroidetes bacterium]|nr:hypothetical protein [Bacteroidota bacterium]